MRLSKFILFPAIFLAAAAIAVLAAWSAVGVIETVSKSTIENELILQGEDWAHVDTDGLQVVLSGTAPSETDRFQALSIAGGQVESSRVIDRMNVPPRRAIAPPRFSVEILRNASGISMIGLVPAATDRDALNQRVSRITLGREVRDLLETANYPVPEGWDAALDFALYALEELPRSKVSMDAERVGVEAIADSAAQKADWERALARRVPGGVRLSLTISAPRPVVTPFTARFVVDEEGARFDACTAGTEEGRTQIIAAGIAAGVNGRPDCTLGLGVPSADWPRAVSTGIAAMRELGAGTITFSDADVSLVAPASVAQRNFDRVVGELEADLPEVFSLNATHTEGEDESGTGTAEFTATLSPEGLVQLRGRLSDAQQRSITESVARARFGIDKVYMAARLDQGLPPNWSVRVLAAIEALSQLDNGAAIVQPSLVELRGNTGNENASAEISRILASKLGGSEEFRVNVTYDEALNPVAARPSPEQCVNRINDILRDSKITFAPGSVEIEASAGPTIDKIADILKDCDEVPMEIGGHTDSQGSEELNKALSQQRANSVLNALLARRVLTSNLNAHGYGEEQPIADNDTEEGREENRRIEFRLIGTEDLPEEEDISEGLPQTADEDLGTLRPRPRPTDEVEEIAQATDEETVEEAGAEDDATTPEDAGAADAEATEEEAPAAGADEATDEEAGEQAVEDAPEADAPEADAPEEDAATGDDTADATDNAGDETGDAATPDADAEAGDVASGEEATETDAPAQDDTTTDNDATETETEDPLAPAVVVHPELEGVSAPPRPER